MTDLESSEDQNALTLLQMCGESIPEQARKSAPIVRSKP
jgi:hypothetical protein